MDEFSLAGLFFASLLGATLLPGGSELVLAAVLKTQATHWPHALLLATLGNTLGGMITFWMGRCLPANTHLPQLDAVQRFGAPSLLFAWLPVVGDALCLAAGWLRLSPLTAALYMALGKAFRYSLIIMALL